MSQKPVADRRNGWKEACSNCATIRFSLGPRIGKEERERVKGSFKDLIVWQKAVKLSFEVYKLTATFPPSEQFGLTNQLRGASVSVASNIAEGYGRSTKGENLQFLGHARGSNCELQTQLVIARGLGFGTDAMRCTAESLSDEIGRMLVVMMKKMRI